VKEPSQPPALTLGAIGEVAADGRRHTETFGFVARVLRQPDEHGESDVRRQFFRPLDDEPIDGIVQFALGKGRRVERVEQPARVRETQRDLRLVVHALESQPD
jgi:hypothetical protein